MTYRVDVLPRAERQLAALRRHAIYPCLSRAMRSLADDPMPPAAEKLSVRGGSWRIRAGDYRVIYEVDDVVRVVAIEQVGHRRDVYRGR
jgi:mRNA interferase RelE/StbE